MGQIQISNEFFKKERNSYSDWPFAFWRELFQNSVDAGAKHIDISVRQISEDSTIVRFNDDGCGFNSEIRDNVFFFLGKTNKDNTSIGGFGKARIVVCFSQHLYQIISQDWRCTGSGSNFETYSNPYFKGCSALVNVDTSDITSIRNSYDENMRNCYMETRLREYLKTTQINCEVSINGSVFTGGCHKRKLAKRLSFGSVYTNKNGNFKGSLIARVSGVTMFKRYINGSNIQVILEIDPNESREVLLSNRDMLHQKYQDELDKFIQCLAIDSGATLRNNHKKFYFLQGNPKVTRRKKTLTKTLPMVEVIKPSPEATEFSGIKSVTIDGSKTFFNTEYYKVDNLIPSAIIISETRNAKVKKVLSKYNPVSWENGSGGNREKILRQWATVCDFVVEEYLDFVEVNELQWRPGFVFSDDAAAMYIKDGTNIACFMLNPVDKNGKISFGLRNKDNWIRMIILACHEVSHFVEEYHNGSFISLEEELIERSICNRNRIFKALLNILKVKTLKQGYF